MKRLFLSQVCKVSRYSKHPEQIRSLFWHLAPEIEGTLYFVCQQVLFYLLVFMTNVKIHLLTENVNCDKGQCSAPKQVKQQDKKVLDWGTRMRVSAVFDQLVKSCALPEWPRLLWYTTELLYITTALCWLCPTVLQTAVSFPSLSPFLPLITVLSPPHSPRILPLPQFVQLPETWLCCRWGDRKGCYLCPDYPDCLYLWQNVELKNCFLITVCKFFSPFILEMGGGWISSSFSSSEVWSVAHLYL